MKLFFAIIGALLAVGGNLPYLRDVLKKRVQPHPYTWFVWSIVSGVTFFGQVVKGAGFAAIAFGASEIFTILIFVFSLRYGFKKIPRRDSYFLIAALLGIIPWFIFRDPTWSVIIMVIIDIIAFVPTFRKTWRHPKTESPILYGSNVLRHGFALIALSQYNIATMLHSVAMIITNTIMTSIIMKKTKPNNSKVQYEPTLKEGCTYCIDRPYYVDQLCTGQGSDEYPYGKMEPQKECLACGRILNE